MRILQWSDAYAPQIGGLEFVVQQLSTELAARGHEVSVITSDGALYLPSFEVMAGIPVNRFPMREALDDQDFLMIRRLIGSIANLKRSFRPDIIHLHFRDATCFFHLQTIRAAAVPCVVTFHGPVYRGNTSRRDSVLTKLLESATWITAVSQATLNEVMTLDKCVSDKSSVIYNARRSFAARHEIPSEGLVFAFGRLSPEKGFNLLLEAFALVLARCPNARLVVVGDGTERKPLEGQAAQLGISDKVDFKGWLSPEKLQDQLAGAWVVVVPSLLNEGFGLVALEAALMSRPVVATRRGGLPEVVQNGVTGLIVEPANPAAMAEAVILLLGNRELAVKLGSRAKAEAERRFPFAAHLDAYEGLYRRLLEDRDAVPSL